jgi:DNA-binding response OmpR family regulator
MSDNNLWRPDPFHPKDRIVEAPPASASNTVLIVEDEPAVRSFCSVVLRRSGYRVVEAGDPAQALSAIASMTEPLDLVLTDMTMPGMNGKEMVRRIQRPDVKVLYMSGYSQNFESGLNLIEKPFTSADLLQRVRATLSSGSISSQP